MSQTRGLQSIGLKSIASYRKLHLVVFVATVFDCDCKTSREFNGLFLLRAVRGVRILCFIGRWHDPVDSRFDEVR